MSDTTDDKPASTPPANEQAVPPVGRETDEAIPVDAVDAVEGQGPGEPPRQQPAGTAEEAGGDRHPEEPPRWPPAENTPPVTEETPARPVDDVVDDAPVTEPEPAAPAPEAPPAADTPSVAEEEPPVVAHTPAPAPEPTTTASETTTPTEPAPAAPAAAVAPEGAGAVPDAPPRPVFDPAPAPPRTAAPPDGSTEGERHEELPAPVATAPGDPARDAPPVPDQDVEDAEVAGASRTSALLRRWPLVILPLIVIAVVVAAFSVKRSTDKAVDKVKAPAFTTFTDKETGFSIRYPSKWTRAERPDPEIRLLVKDEGLNSLLVRVARTPAPFPADLTGAEAKQVADVVLKRETFAPERILREQAVNVNGAPGYYYLYTFDEPVESGTGTQTVQGVHAHYLVFSGRRVFVLVFQALPTANFDKLAKTFDTMAESFRITPLASDAPDPTTAPAPTTAPDPAAPSTAPPAPPETPASAPPG